MRMRTRNGDIVNMHARLRSLAAGAGAIALLLSSISCGDVARQGRAPTMLVIESMAGASGADPGTMSAFLLSDVQTIVEQNIGGQTVRVPTIFNDVGEASLRLVMKNPTGTTPSTLNAVTLSRYRIEYLRADGRNTPGVDVPFPVDGGVTATVGGASVSVGFEFVRHQAKLEQPLRSLANFGGRLFIATIAQVTFYGTDLAGNNIQATGTMNVSFSDYADPE